MQTVDIPGYGEVDFPDDMDDAAIKAVIKRKFLPKAQTKEPQVPQAPNGPVIPDEVSHASDTPMVAAGRSIGRDLKEVGAGALEGVGTLAKGLGSMGALAVKSVAFPEDIPELGITGARTDYGNLVKGVAESVGGSVKKRIRRYKDAAPGPPGQGERDLAVIEAILSGIPGVGPVLDTGAEAMTGGGGEFIEGKPRAAGKLAAELVAADPGRVAGVAGKAGKMIRGGKMTGAPATPSTPVQSFNIVDQVFDHQTGLKTVSTLDDGRKVYAKMGEEGIEDARILENGKLRDLDYEEMDAIQGAINDYQSKLPGGNTWSVSDAQAYKDVLKFNQVPKQTPTVPTPRSIPGLSPNWNQRLQGFLEGTFTGSGPFHKMRQSQAKAVQEIAEGIASDVSSFKGSPEELGQMVQGAREKARAGIKNKASTLYQQADELSKGVLVDARDVADSASLQVDRLRAAGAPVPPALERLTKFKKAGQVPFQQLRDIRTTLLDATRPSFEAGTTGTVAIGASKKLAGEIKELLGQHASTRPGLKDLLDSADELWRHSESFDKDLLARIAKVDPEKVHPLLSTASLEDIANVKKILPKKVMQAAKARILRDLLEDSVKQAPSTATVPDISVGGLTLGAAKEARLNPGALTRQLDKLDGGVGRLQALYSAEEIAGIKQVADAATKAGIPTHTWVSSLGALVSAKMIHGVAMGAITGDAGRVAQNLGGALMMNAAARLITKPHGSKLVSEFIKLGGAAGPGPAQLANASRLKYLTAQLGRMMNQEAEALAREEKGSRGSKGSKGEEANDALQ